MGLAILGSKPRYQKPLYIVKPFFPSKNYFLKVYNTLNKSRILTNDGPFVRQLEKKLARLLNVKHFIAISSATTGLLLLIKALDLKGEVIIPSFTFVATAHSLQWQNIKPVFADIESNNLTIDPEDLTPLLTSKTTAVMGVHLFGNPCNIERLESFCKKHRLKLIFDSAQAFGSSYKNRLIGSFGIAEVFSLHATKIINSLEGGGIATNNAALAEKLILFRNYGFCDYDRVISLGINGKMNEVSAAIGLNSLSKLNDHIQSNKENHAIYNKLLKNVPGITFPKNRNNCKTNYNYYYILINEEFGLSRDLLSNIFWKENIITRSYFSPGCHKHEPYRSSKISYNNLKNTERVANSILCLPCFPGLGEKNIKKIVSVIVESYEKKTKIKNNIDSTRKRKR